MNWHFSWLKIHEYINTATEEDMKEIIFIIKTYKTILNTNEIIRDFPFEVRRNYKCFFHFRFHMNLYFTVNILKGQKIISRFS